MDIKRILELNSILNECNSAPIYEADHSEPDGDEDEFGNEPDDHEEDLEEIDKK